MTQLPLYLYGRLNFFVSPVPSDEASEGPVAAVHWLTGGPGLPVDHVFGWDYFLSYTGLLQYENVIFFLQYENVIHRASGSRIPV